MFWTFLVSGHPRRAARQAAAWYRLRYSRSAPRLHLGCGLRRLDGFVNVDHNYSPAVDYVCDILALPCRASSIERIEAYHVIEHISHRKIGSLLAEWHRILVPGGMLVLECPDFDRQVEDYLAGNSERVFNIFGRQRFAGDAHLFGYNEVRLKRLLERSGFSKVVGMPPCDYHSKDEPCMRVECVKP